MNARKSIAAAITFEIYRPRSPTFDLSSSDRFGLRTFSFCSFRELKGRDRSRGVKNPTIRNKRRSRSHFNWSISPLFPVLKSGAKPDSSRPLSFPIVTWAISCSFPQFRQALRLNILFCCSFLDLHNSFLWIFPMDICALLLLKWTVCVKLSKFTSSCCFPLLFFFQSFSASLFGCHHSQSFPFGEKKRGGGGGGGWCH